MQMRNNRSVPRKSWIAEGAHARADFACRIRDSARDLLGAELFGVNHEVPAGKRYSRIDEL